MDQEPLYIFQREFAVVNTQEGFCWVDSDDATTCTIVLIKTVNSPGKCVAAHFDSGDLVEDALKAMISSYTTLERQAGLHVYLVGGYCDEDHQGFALCSAILRTLHNSPLSNNETKVHLRLACVQQQNTKVIDVKLPTGETKKVNAPKVTGAAISILTGEVLPAKFVDRGPEVCLRSLLTLVGENAQRQLKHSVTPSSSSSLSSTSVSTNSSVSPTIFIGPWKYALFRDAPLLLQFNDYDLLHNTSTSPFVEGQNFVTDFRNCLKHSIANPNWQNYFKEGQPKVYLREAGSWALQSAVTKSL